MINSIFLCQICPLFWRKKTLCLYIHFNCSLLTFFLYPLFSRLCFLCLYVHIVLHIVFICMNLSHAMVTFTGPSPCSTLEPPTRHQIPQLHCSCVTLITVLLMIATQRVTLVHHCRHHKPPPLLAKIITILQHCDPP